LEKHKDNLSLEQGSLRDMTGELSTADNHPADLGTELYEREKDLALKVHEDSELLKVNEALEAMNKGTYGVCDECGESIPYERLEAMPYTTRCMEHADKTFPQDRPVEEQVLHPSTIILLPIVIKMTVSEIMRTVSKKSRNTVHLKHPPILKETLLTSTIYMTIEKKKVWTKMWIHCMLHPLAVLTGKFPSLNQQRQYEMIT
jgi:YteA family regulatory protein